MVYKDKKQSDRDIELIDEFLKADIMDMKFSRIQFTPDLMPSDITGTEILQETDKPGHRAFEFIKGPVFANIVLADNRSKGGCCSERGIHDR